MTVLSLCGDNVEGAPVPEVLQTLQERRTLRAGQLGNIEIVTDGQQLWVYAKKPLDPGSPMEMPLPTEQHESKFFEAGPQVQSSQTSFPLYLPLYPPLSDPLDHQILHRPNAPRVAFQQDRMETESTTQQKLACTWNQSYTDWL